jgi:hypothetical protein
VGRADGDVGGDETLPDGVLGGKSLGGNLTRTEPLHDVLLVEENRVTVFWKYEKVNGGADNVWRKRKLSRRPSGPPSFNQRL